MATSSLEAQSLSVAMTSDPNLHLDSNKPCVEGPRAAYIGYEVSNNSGTSVKNVTATLTGITAPFQLEGGQNESVYIGTMRPGTKRMVYYYLSYGCTHNVTTSPLFSIRSNGQLVGSTSSQLKVSSSISAQAGGIIVNGLVGPGAIIGQVLYMDAEYRFGGADAGYTYSFQPAGNLDFNARCFQLTSTEVLSSTVTAVPVGSIDQTYFTATRKQPGNGFTAKLRYYFKYLCTATSSVAQPYATQISGGSNLKYAGNYDTYVGPTLPIATNPFSISKEANITLMPQGGRVTYTITINNPSPFNSSIDSIADILPAGAIYQGIQSGSTVTEANAAEAPAVGSTGRVVWRGTPGESFNIPAGGTIKLIYAVDIPNQAAAYDNHAFGYIGIESIGDAQVRVNVGADIRVILNGPLEAIKGDTLNFTLTLHNLGPTSGTEVSGGVALPSALQFVEADSGGVLSGQSITWPVISEMAINDSTTYSFKALTVSPGSHTTIASATATSADSLLANNNGTATFSRTTTVIVQLGVRVSPEGLPEGPLQKLPGSGYSQSFTIHSESGQETLYGLRVHSDSASIIETISVAGSTIQPGGSLEESNLSLAIGDSAKVVVQYRVPVGHSATGRIAVDAWPSLRPMLSSTGWVDVRRVTPTISISHGASILSPLPGSDVEFAITFANVGERDATGVQIVEDIESPLEFRLGSAFESLPHEVAAVVEYSTGGVDWSYTPTSGGCGAPAGYDACVRSLRWTFSGALPAMVSPAAGELRYGARLP